MDANRPLRSKVMGDFLETAHSRNLQNMPKSRQKGSTLFSTRIERKISIENFLITEWLKFSLLSPLNGKSPVAETGRGSYIIGFMCSEFLRIFKNSFILIRIL